jgi:Uma2 family endonuclease
MGGASFIHNLITANLVRLMGNFVVDQDFFVCQSDMRVHNPVTGSYFYPDVVVTQGEPEFADDQFDSLLNPILVIEVLSSGTETYDRGDKAYVYRHIPSLREYLILSQEEASAEHWTRLEENKWQLEEIKGLEQTLHVLGGSCKLKLEDVYRKVNFKI